MTGKFHLFAKVQIWRLVRLNEQSVFPVCRPQTLTIEHPAGSAYKASKQAASHPRSCKTGTLAQSLFGRPPMPDRESQTH